MEFKWETDFTIEVKIVNGAAVISANKAGLISLANHLICLADETFDAEKDMIIFDPIETWKKTKLKGGTYTRRELLVQIFKNGECCYESPSVMELRDICTKEKNTLWEESLRFVNPHQVYVDLSQKLFDVRAELLNKYGQV